MIFKTIFKYPIIIVLIIIVVFLGVTKIRYRNVNWESVYPITTPTATPTSAPKINLDYPLWELLPYAGNDFVIDRYSEPQVLVVKTKNINTKIVTQEVYGWLTENNVATESHRLVFEKEN